MSPWEKKRPGFRPSQHLWKCSRVTTTKSTCQHPAQWTSLPRLQRLQLPHTPNELVWMPICLLQWKGEMRRKRKNKEIFSTAVAWNHLPFSQIWRWHRNTVLVLNREQPWPGWGILAINLGLWVQNGTVPDLGVGGEFGDGRRRRATESRVLTRQSVYIPEGNFSPWEGSRAGGGGGNMSLGLVSGRRASRRSGGTWTCGWYIKTHTDIDLRQTNRWNLYLYLC